MQANKINRTGGTVGAGTHDDPIRYSVVDENDPDRGRKLAAQRKQFSDDASSGKVVCLTELFGSHGL